MNPKEVVQKVSNPFLRVLLQKKAMVILSNWFVQSFLYMNNYERLCKIIWEVFLFLPIFYVFKTFLSLYLAITASLLFSHTLNWLFNGHFYGLVKEFGGVSTSPKVFLTYLDGIYERFSNKSFIMGAAIFGSIARGEYKPSSDLDFRLFIKPGFWNGLAASHLCLIERFRAFLNKFPLDIYAFSLEEVKNKMRADEIPIILYDPEGKLVQAYPKAKFFKEFRKEFAQKYLL